MDFLSTDWRNTKDALHGLEKLLTCTVCKEIVQNPCTLGGCEHFFCRTCAENVVDKDCPVCNMPSHVKDIQTNRQLKMTVSLCKQLSMLLHSSSDEVDFPDIVQDNEVEVTSTPLNQLIPLRSSRNTNEAPGMSVFEFANSPVDSPAKPIARRTRKAQAKQKKEQFIKKSSAEWSIGENKLDKCTSCRKRQPERERQRVTFERAAKSGNTHYVEDSETISLGTSSGIEDLCTDEEDETGEEEIKPKLAKTSKCAGRKKEPPPVVRKASEKLGRRTAKQTGKCNSQTSPQLTDYSPGSKTSKVSVDDSSSGFVSKSYDSYYGTPSKVEKRPSLSPTVPLVKTSTPDSSSTKDKKVAMLNATPTSTQRENKSNRMSGRSKSSGARNLSPLIQSTPTRIIKRTESPGKSPSLLKRNPKGETALHRAVIKGDYEKAKELLEQGAPTNVKDNAGWTPLHEACNHGFVQIAELLLDHGALINIPGFDNETPLHDAVVNNKINVVKLLVSRGASVTDRNANGSTPLDLAAFKANEMKEALETPLANTQASRTAVSLPEEFAVHQVVFLATSLSRDQKRKLDQLAQILHTKCVEDYSHEVTHLVAHTNDDNLCARTMKYLKCLITGKWIVNFEWVEHCIALKLRVSEEPFAVTSCSPDPEAQGPECGRNNMLNQFPGLFNRCHLHLKGNWEGQDDLKHDIMQLIELGGGQLLVREPKMETIIETQTVPYHTSPESKLSHCSHYIVHRAKDAKARMTGSRLCNVSFTWIIDCCANFQLIEPV